MNKSSLLSFFMLTMLLAGSFLTTNNITKAQISNLTDDIIVEVIPQNPSPGQQVRVEVESFTSNLQQANIIWTIDGVVEQQEIGNQAFRFITPEAGTVVQVGVTATYPNGRVVSRSLTVAPNNIDVLMEGVTYTPPLYKGRPLFTHESQVNIAAIPTLIENGRALTSDEIFYGWEINGTYYRDISGVGRDNIIYTGSVVSRPVTITVTAENILGTLKAKKVVTIEPEEVELYLYENNPLQGTIYEKALLGEFNLQREELTVIAIPYFFDVTKQDDEKLEFAWGENGTKINNPLLSNALTFRNTGLQKSGVSTIATVLEHTDNILQDASIGFTLNVIGSNQINTQNNDVSVF